MKVLITGSAGFIAGYTVELLLEQGHQVVGIDNYGKYGRLTKSYDNHPNYRMVEGDAKDTSLLKTLLADCEHFVAMAAMIGGISYFHQFAYDLMAENERIMAASCDAALWAHQHAQLKKITVMSSSMVYENSKVFPTPEGEERKCPPPSSTYGFQKLACEYFVQGAHEQYQLPYTILRPFNCVGIGERRALTDVEIPSGNIKLALSHVVPDLVHKCLKGQDPLHLLGSGEQVRHFTYGGDLAEGIVLSLEHPNALNQDFNLSTPVPTKIIDLARLIWKKIQGDKPFRVVHDEPFAYDVPFRSPDVQKAEKLLGYRAKTSLDAMLDEVIPWIREQVQLGTI